MAEISDLRMRTHMRHAFVLLIDGTPWIWTDERALTSGWWTLDDRQVIGGLRVDQHVTFSGDITDTGLLEEDAITIEITDAEGPIPSFFGGLSKKFQRLGQRVYAGTDPIIAPLIGADQDVLPADEGGYLGLEAIGPNGERAYYQAMPWGSLPGPDHPIIDEPYPVFTTRETGPLLVEGRRVALYQILYDPDVNAWRNWGDHVTAAAAGGWSPVYWWGVLRQAGSVNGKVWTLQCSGPGALLRRSVAHRMPTQWFPVIADVAFKDSEKKITIDFYKSEINGFDTWYGHDATTYTIPNGVADDIATYLSNAIETVSNQAGDAGVWTDDTPIAGAGGVISFGLSGCTISTLQSCGFAGRLHLILHARVWRRLGYDPLFEIGNLDGPQPLFLKQGNQGYYMGIFSTVPEGKDPIGQDGTTEWDGDGIPRNFAPLYGGEGVSVLSGLGNQVIKLQVEDQQEIYCESQTVRTRQIGAQIEGVDTDSSRWWVFKGPIQKVGQEEPEETYQVARCSWIDVGGVSGGTILPDSSGITRGLRIYKWYDPRLFGLDYEPIDPFIGWASNDGAEDPEERITASPLSMFGVFDTRPDYAHHTILRTLCSTGTGYWGVTEDAPDDALIDYAGTWFVDGSNSTGEAYPATDVEIFDMGLQIPSQMIDVDSIKRAAENLPGGATGPLAVGKVAVQGASIQSEDLLGALMQPRGWCISLKRGKYGLFTPHLGSEQDFEEGVDFEITPSDLAGEAGVPDSTLPEVELRPVNPFDRVVLSHTGNPTEGWLDGQREYLGKARDPGARARTGTVTRDVKGPDLISKQWFAGDKANKVDPDFVKSPISKFQQLWERDIAGWLSAGHKMIKGLRISRPKGQDIYPGNVIRLTHPSIPNSTGGYGVTGAFCRVISVSRETDSGVATIECLLEYLSPNALRWAPILRVVDDVAEDIDRYDPSAKTFYLQPWGGSQPPLSAFIKPPTLDAEDEPAKVIGLQYDGVTWQQSFSFFVDSIDTGANSITHTLAGLTGAFSQRHYTCLVLAPASDSEQAEWCRVLYAQHTSLPAPTDLPKLSP